MSIATTIKIPGMNYIRKLYDWTLSWAESPYGLWALFFLAFAESSFFPIPPDVLLIALTIGKPKKALIFAAVCSLGSVLGGIMGYFIGSHLWHLAEPILHFYGWYDKINVLGEMYRQHAAWAVAAAGFTPIPYKVFTITGGYFNISFPVFIIASTIARTARFMIVAGMIRLFGEKIKNTIDKYFNLATLLFFVLLVGGFLVVKLFIKH